nr:DNA-binding protein [Mycobacterium sp. UM_NZ2]
MIQGHDLQEVVDAGHAPSVRWLREGIRRGEIPGYRVARKGTGGRCDYRMTDADIEAFIESRRIVPAIPSRTGLNLTPGGARRLTAVGSGPA